MSRYPRPSYTPSATRPPPAPRSQSGPANYSMANFYKNSTAEMGNLICILLNLLPDTIII